MNKKEIFYINTDGGSRGNPGQSGAGAVILNDKNVVLKTGTRALGVMTNNEAEYQAVVFGLKLFKSALGKDKAQSVQIVLRIDSELVAKQLRGEYQIKEEKLFPLFIEIWNLRVKDFPNLEIVHVLRAQNSLADELANKAMDEQAQGRLI